MGEQHSQCAHAFGTSWLQLLCSHCSFLCLSALPCVHLLLTVSTLIQGQLRLWQTWPCKAHVPPCTAGQDKATPAGGTATLLGDSPQHWPSVEPESQECSVLPCPYNGQSVEPSGTSHPNGGTWGHPPPKGHLPRVYSEPLREAQHTLHG